MTPAEIAAMANAAGEATDHTQAPESTDRERNVAAPGKGVCRFVEYIELGKHSAASAMYPDKKPVQKARFTFELLSPRHIQEFPQEGKETLRIPHRVSIELAMPDHGKPAHEKSAYHKIFGKLNHAGTFKHPAQCLGAAYIIDIVAGYSSDDLVGGKPKPDAKPKYANFKDADGSFLLTAPRIIDPIDPAKVTEVPVPQLMGALRLFLWNKPSKAAWDALHIEGTYKAKDGSDVSKNWLQEKIQSALDWNGSPLQALLVTGNAAALADLPVGGTQSNGVPQPTSAPGAVDPLASFGL